MFFSGSYVALITPFNRRGQIDGKALEELIIWHIQEGTDGLVCCATTGEGATLSEKERKRVAAICVQTAAGRIPIIVGTGTSDTRQSVRLTEEAQKLGADGCLVITPYYNKPSAKGCLRHFQEVASVGLPVVLYHNPARSAVRLSAEVLAEAGKIPGVVALKESSHDLALIRRLRELSSLPIFSGEDDLAFAALREGAVGAISVVGNLIPRFWKEVVQRSLEERWEVAERLFMRTLPLCKALFLETNPQGVKFALEWMGKCSGSLRLPLVEVSEAVQQELCTALVSLFLPQWDRSSYVTRD